MFSPWIVTSLFFAGLSLHLAFRRLRNNTIAYLPGPPPGTWLVGNIPALFRPINVGDADFAWTNTFGSSVKIKGVFGSDVLFTTDPKSFQHILNTSCYDYPKAPFFRFLLAIFGGKGIVWAEGALHSRHRKLMDPAFSYTSVRKHLPLFRKSAHHTVAKWKDMILQSRGTSTTIDVTSWMARTTMDILGTTAFDYPFEALDKGTASELYQCYSNLRIDAFLERTDFILVFEELCGLAPEWVLSILLQILPPKNITKLQEFMAIARRIARAMVSRRVDSHAKGDEDSQDILSMLVSANSATKKLTDEELLANLTTLMIAGHETTASTLTWALYEISKHPGLQNEVRQEIKIARTRAAQRGDVELSALDLDAMRCLTAILKETLRYHPILPQMMRIAAHDDIIPLSMPQKTKTGELITGIPVSKGQVILLSVAAFNRMPSIWGEDADIWRPQRFLEANTSDHKTGVGVLANIATFSSGTRNCIGWRFAMLEMQSVLAELIENFEFSRPENVEILRAGTVVMIPMVKGANVPREELPLIITPVA